MVTEEGAFFKRGRRHEDRPIQADEPAAVLARAAEADPAAHIRFKGKLRVKPRAFAQASDSLQHSFRSACPDSGKIFRGKAGGDKVGYQAGVPPGAILRGNPHQDTKSVEPLGKQQIRGGTRPQRCLDPDAGTLRAQGSGEKGERGGPVASANQERVPRRHSEASAKGAAHPQNVAGPEGLESGAEGAHPRDREGKGIFSRYAEGLFIDSG